jgi:hypothetical protein
LAKKWIVDCKGITKANTTCNYFIFRKAFKTSIKSGAIVVEGGENDNIDSNSTQKIFDKLNFSIVNMDLYKKIS